MRETGDPEVRPMCSAGHPHHEVERLLCSNCGLEGGDLPGEECRICSDGVMQTQGAGSGSMADSIETATEDARLLALVLARNWDQLAFDSRRDLDETADRMERYGVELEPLVDRIQP